jgi:hypothetical protein
MFSKIPKNFTKYIGKNKSPTEKLNTTYQPNRWQIYTSRTMKTRSQTNAEILDVNIDFDEASRYWNANKKRTGNGSYVYVCGAQLKNGNFCKRSMQPCFMHRHDTVGL